MAALNRQLLQKGKMNMKCFSHKAHALPTTLLFIQTRPHTESESRVKFDVDLKVSRLCKFCPSLFEVVEI